MSIQNQGSRNVAIFYKKALKNNFKSEQEGRDIFEDCDMVKIYTAGDSLNVIDTFVRPDHKEKYPLEWANYMNKHGNEPKITGTPLTSWPLISTAQAEELRAMKFFTVEQVAGASDAQIQSIGMASGMSPYTFRDRAINFLKVAKDESEVSKHEEELRTLREENAKIKSETEAKLAAMQEQMANILAAVGEKTPRSRKAKEVEET